MAPVKLDIQYWPLSISSEEETPSYHAQVEEPSRISGVRPLMDDIENDFKNGGVRAPLLSKARIVLDQLRMMDNVAIDGVPLPDAILSIETLLGNIHTQGDGLGELHTLVQRLTTSSLPQTFMGQGSSFNPVTPDSRSWGLMQMQISKRYGISQRLIQEVLIQASFASALSPQNWNAVTAFNEWGTTPLYLDRAQLPISGLTLDERLAAIDKANEMFRYDYIIEESYSGEQTFYKVPLMRVIGVSVDDVKIRISRQEFEIAKLIIEGAGNLQRIVRAVPYSNLRQSILDHLRVNQINLKDVTIVGIDRGGRIPTLITKWALGLPVAHFIEVDQGLGTLDEKRLARLVREGVFQNRFVIFVDSTVDSGVQIDVLSRYLNSNELNHRGWVVVGSNEDGRTLEHHLNVNWGVDPDTTFEESPALLGFNYGDRNLKEFKSIHSKFAHEIRRAFAEVPKGVVLDTSDNVLLCLGKAQKASQTTEEIINSTHWCHALDEYQLRSPDLQLSSTDPSPSALAPLKLSIIGDQRSDVANLAPDARALAQNLSMLALNVGTTSGVPGSVLEALVDVAPHAKVTLFEDWDEEKRFHMMMSSDAILVTPGGEETLIEAMVALEGGKRVVVVRDWGPVAIYLQHGNVTRKYRNLYVMPTLQSAVVQLTALASRTRLRRGVSSRSVKVTTLSDVEFEKRILKRDLNQIRNAQKGSRKMLESERPQVEAQLGYRPIDQFSADHRTLLESCRQQAFYLFDGAVPEVGFTAFYEDGSKHVWSSGNLKNHPLQTFLKTGQILLSEDYEAMDFRTDLFRILFGVARHANSSQLYRLPFSELGKHLLRQLDKAEELARQYWENNVKTQGRIREQLIADLQMRAKTLGRLPSNLEMGPRAGVASVSKYISVFGNWEKAVVAAGLTPRPSGQIIRHWMTVNQPQKGQSGHATVGAMEIIGAPVVLPLKAVYESAKLALDAGRITVGRAIAAPQHLLGSGATFVFGKYAAKVLRHGPSAVFNESPKHIAKDAAALTIGGAFGNGLASAVMKRIPFQAFQKMGGIFTHVVSLASAVIASQFAQKGEISAAEVAQSVATVSAVSVPFRSALWMLGKIPWVKRVSQGAKLIFGAGKTNVASALATVAVEFFVFDMVDEWLTKRNVARTIDATRNHVAQLLEDDAILLSRKANGEEVDVHAIEAQLQQEAAQAAATKSPEAVWRQITWENQAKYLDEWRTRELQTPLTQRSERFKTNAAIEAEYTRQIQKRVAERKLDAPDASRLMTLWRDSTLAVNGGYPIQPLGLPGDLRSTTNEIPDKAVVLADEGTLIAKQIEDYLVQRREFLKRYEKIPAPAAREQGLLVAQNDGAWGLD